METIFLSPIKDQLAGFRKFTALEMMYHLFRAYGAIGNIYLEENNVNIMGPSNPAEPIACIIEQLGRRI